MNIIKLEFNKFIRGKLLPLILCIFVALVGAVFYKNYLDFQQIDTDKKHELVKIKGELQDILYPHERKSLYADDENKMQVLKEAYEISEKTMTSKHRGDENVFMENAIKMYEKIIEVKDNDITFSFSKSFAEHEKNRLMEILKIKGNFYYEEAPLDSVVLLYKNIRESLIIIFLITIFYFFTTIYFDFKNHKGFLFTLPIRKSNFVIGKSIISIVINIVLITLQFIINLGFGKIWKWQNNFKYPVFYDKLNEFIPVNRAIIFDTVLEIAICVIVLIISTVVLKTYVEKKSVRD